MTTRLPHLGRLVALDDLEGGARLVVGCSGGADSLALLALVRAAGFDAVATYVDHGLRCAAEHEAAIVAAAAQRFGAAFVTVRIDVGWGANLEARARDMRYDALERVRAEHGAVATVVGHTVDDQAETVLLNLLRGSGTRGLAGMPPARGTLRRPLLRLRRADTCEICARLGLAPVADPMNDDVHHRRVWLRREVIPQLEAGAGRDIVELLARSASLAAEDDALLEELTGDAGRPDEPLEAAAVLALAPPLASRAVRRWLGPPMAASADVDAVLALLRGDRRAVELAGRGRIERVQGRAERAGLGAGARSADAVVALPGIALAGPVVIESWIELAPPVAWPSGRATCVVDADCVGTTATLRVARPGERFRPLGLGGTRTVFDALAASGVPASVRSERLVLAADENSVLPSGAPWWVLGYRVDDRVRVTSSTRRYLWVNVRGSAE